MGNITKDLYNEIMNNHCFTVDGLRYVKLSDKLDCYDGYFRGEQNHTFLVLSEDEEICYMTLYTELYDVDSPIDYCVKIEFIQCIEQVIEQFQEDFGKKIVDDDLLYLKPEEEEVAVAAVKLRRLHIFMEKRKTSERSYNL